MQLTLTDDEAELLRDMLSAHLGDLRRQISHTDNSSFREQLRSEKNAVKGLLTKLGMDVAAA